MATFHLTSSAFKNEAHIPRKFTADGAGTQHHMSPPLSWSGVPEGTTSLAIIVEDVDAPDPAYPIVPFVHWVVVNIPPTLTGLPAGFNSKDVEGKEEYGELQEGVNDLKVPGYRGPSPATGVHRIEYKLYALDTNVHLGHKVTKDKLVEAMEGHVLAAAILTGTFTREKFGKGEDFYPTRGKNEGQGL